MTSPRAGQPAQPGDLVDVAALLSAYSERTPDPADPAQQVVFGTSGHRGSSLDSAFNEGGVIRCDASSGCWMLASGVLYRPLGR